jgi:ATP-dependent DNA ligase
MICLKPSLNFSGDFLEIVSAARSIHAARCLVGCCGRLGRSASAANLWRNGVAYLPPFIEPCLPSPSGEQPPTGSDWVHEIKHEGYRLMARRDPAVIAPHELMVKLGRSLPSQYWAHPF